MIKNNKLFCTFCVESDIEGHINTINNKYQILYNKIFVLESCNLENKEFILTYNTDLNNTSSEAKLPNTIQAHRVKRTNTLYSIDGLNELIKILNEGILDNKFMIPWEKYRNSLLVTKNKKFNHIETKIFKIIELES
jgi:hypothetical protein